MTPPMRLTRDRLRADVAAALGLAPEAIGCDDHLPDLGLDSMRLMSLVLGWEAEGWEADFATLAEDPTLGAWWRELDRLRAAAG